MENNSGPTKSIIFLNELTTLQNWKREQTLGSGSFAIITLWVDTQTSERVALKQFRNLGGFVNEQVVYYNEQWKQEIEMMKRLKCESVVKALDLPVAFRSLRLDMPILAMEFCSGGDLRKVLNKPYNCCGLEEKEVRQILQQISSAIGYLHNLNIIHRDIKPEVCGARKCSYFSANAFTLMKFCLSVLQPISRGKILYKLTDLGYAKQLSDSALANSFVGTLEYLAPELILRVKYSRAVDNWSFGLLAYEVITGRRPFLPNHAMGEILEVLKKKKSSQHICTEIDEQGNFYFSSEISQFNHICSTLKVDLESWLRLVLEYDPTKRGDKRAFQLISEIMHKHVVQVFSIDTYETFSYEINAQTTLNELQTKLSANTNIASGNQYLILPNGEMAQESLGKQITEAWYKPESWLDQYNPIVMFVFDCSKELDYYEFYKSLTLPQKVEKMLLDPSRSTDYDEVKLTWRHSVWVARQSVKKYQILHSALKSCLLHCINVYNRLQNKHQQLDGLCSGLFASSAVLANFLRFSSAQGKQLLSESMGEKTNVGAIKANLEMCGKVATILKGIYQFRREKVKLLFEKTRSIVPRFSKDNFIFENFLKSSDVDTSLMRKYNDILAAYDSLRKRKKEERSKPTPNNHMVSILCDCFQQVETLMKQMFQILKTFVKFIKDIQQLSRENAHFQHLIDNWQKTTAVLHSESWASLTACFAPEKSSRDIHSQLQSLTVSSNRPQSSRPTTENLQREFEKIDALLIELEQGHTSGNSEPVDFTHLEFYNLLF